MNLVICTWHLQITKKLKSLTLGDPIQNGIWCQYPLSINILIPAQFTSKYSSHLVYNKVKARQIYYSFSSNHIAWSVPNMKLYEPEFKNGHPLLSKYYCTKRHRWTNLLTVLLWNVLLLWQQLRLCYHNIFSLGFDDLIYILCKLNIVPRKASFEYKLNCTIFVTYNPHLVGLIYGQSSIMKCVHALFIGMEGVKI